MKRNTVFNLLPQYTISCCLYLFTLFTFSQTDIFEVSRSGTLEDIESIYKTNPELINTQNESGYSPLTLACYRGNTAVAKFLAKKVKDINTGSKFGTPLMAATYKGYTDIVEVLLNNDAKTDLQDQNGETVAHYAVFFKKYNIIKLLVAAETNFDIPNARGQTAKDYAKMYNQEKINELLNL